MIIKVKSVTAEKFCVFNTESMDYICLGWQYDLKEIDRIEENKITCIHMQNGNILYTGNTPEEIYDMIEAKNDNRRA